MTPPDLETALEASLYAMGIDPDHDDPNEATRPRSAPQGITSESADDPYDGASAEFYEEFCPPPAATDVRALKREAKATDRTYQDAYKMGQEEIRQALRESGVKLPKSRSSDPKAPTAPVGGSGGTSTPSATASPTMPAQPALDPNDWQARLIRDLMSSQPRKMKAFLRRLAWYRAQGTGFHMTATLVENVAKRHPLKMRRFMKSMKWYRRECQKVGRKLA